MRFCQNIVNVHEAKALKGDRIVERIAHNSSFIQTTKMMRSKKKEIHTEHDENPRIFRSRKASFTHLSYFRHSHSAFHRHHVNSHLVILCWHCYLYVGMLFFCFTCQSMSCIFHSSLRKSKNGISAIRKYPVPRMMNMFMKKDEKDGKKGFEKCIKITSLT